MEPMKKLAITLAIAASCASPDAPVVDADSNDDDIIVTPGKEDDFFSSSAKEFWVTGVGTLTVEDGVADPLARARELYTLKNLQISWFLDQYLVEKDEPGDYGGFSALTRFTSEETGELTQVNARSFHFPFTVQIAGDRRLLSRLPGEAVAGGKRFDLQIGKVANDKLAQLDVNHEWYREAPWAEFDPATLPASQLESITLTVTPQPAPTDRWLDYARLFADDELTIAVHFGWDYNGRLDLRAARNLHDKLVRDGWDAPSATFERVQRTSRPYQTTIYSNGRAITVKLWSFHAADAALGVPGPNPDTAEGGKQLEDDLRASLATREVVIFQGHSGPLFGFALANWHLTLEGDLDDSEIPGLNLPRSYQIVFADGCDTYALGQAFWNNPAKADRQNLNIITSTAASNAARNRSLLRFVDALTNQRAGKVVPAKVSELVAGLDEDQGEGFHTMYGVHGLDANPTFDPMSDATRLCDACTTHTSCGADGNRCTKLGSGSKVCSFACIDDSGCPTDYACRAVASATTAAIKSYQCVPASGVCR
jgi:hypothetical protein